jgi:hypothetical protein
VDCVFSTRTTQSIGGNAVPTVYKLTVSFLHRNAILLTAN